MIPTKTYPLSAIMGGEISDKERIAELEAELTMRREQAEGLQNQWVRDTQKIVKLEAQLKHAEGHAAELEAENKALRVGVEKMLTRLEARGFTNDDPLFLDLNTIYWAAREGK